MGFENLPQAIDISAALTPPTPEQIKFAKEKLADEKALGIVLQDVVIAEQYLSSKAIPQDWNLADELYRAYVQPKKWDGSDQYRANLGMALVMEVVETLLPQIHLAFFSDKQPFLCVAKGKTSSDAARATAKILNWAVKISGFKEEIRKALKNCLLYGNGVGKWGWRSEDVKTKKYCRDAQGAVNMEPGTKTVTYPTFESVELGNILVDPALRNHDIRNARKVVHQKFIDFSDLDEMRADATYKNIPTRAQLKEILAERSEECQDALAASKLQNWRQHQAELQKRVTSSDPTQQPLELLEYVTEDRVITVLQGTIVIRNEENELDKLNYLSCAFIDVPKSWHGFGIAKLLDGEQRLEQGTANAWIDGLSLSLTPAWHRKNGVGDRKESIQISPGKVVNDTGELEPLKTDSISAEALEVIQTSEARARRRVGANFGSEMPNQAMRTAEGVQEFTASLQVRLQYFVEIFAELVFIPALEAFIELAKDNMSPNQINAILTEEEGQAFQGDILDVYNGQCGIDVLTSTKMAARRAMASMIPMLTQFFSAEPVQDSLAVQNKKVDYVELVKQALDLTGWDSGEIIIEMTQEDQQRSQAMNPAVVKAQADAAKQKQGQQDMLEQIAANGDARAGVSVIKHVLKENEQAGHSNAKELMGMQHDHEAEMAAAEPLANQPAK